VERRHRLIPRPLALVVCNIPLEFCREVRGGEVTGVTAEEFVCPLPGEDPGMPELPRPGSDKEEGRRDRGLDRVCRVRDHPDHLGKRFCDLLFCRGDDLEVKFHHPGSLRRPYDVVRPLDPHRYAGEAGKPGDEA